MAPRSFVLVWCPSEEGEKHQQFFKFTIETVLLTAGRKALLKCLRDHEYRGFKWSVCGTLCEQQSTCPDGDKCEHLHISPEGFEKREPYEVHLLGNGKYSYPKQVSVRCGGKAEGSKWTAAAPSGPTKSQGQGVGHTISGPAALGAEKSTAAEVTGPSATSPAAPSGPRRSKPQSGPAARLEVQKASVSMPLVTVGPRPNPVVHNPYDITGNAQSWLWLERKVHNPYSYEGFRI